ncbi:FGGY family carbohydrate kinase [Rhizobium sp. IBUN]|uniref:FGGY-family carbohydrate kinase n=1 Tax=Rhizobium sp. IBUN TaxID=1042326 RepID=UPI0003F6F699|nr:FGGY family carbohydrate kinase [Rhizobium sp. IBUN]
MSAKPDLILGIDAGGTTAKAALFDIQGNLIAVHRRQLPTVTSRGGGRAERDPDLLWEAVAAAVRDLLSSADNDRAARVAAVCATGFGGGLFAVGSNGKTIGPAILSSDRRAILDSTSLNKGPLCAAISSTLGIELWSAWSLPLFRWIHRSGDHTYDRADKILWCKDFIRLRLTGIISTDPTDAATAGLLDLNRETYARDLISEACGDVWLDRLPEILPSDAIAGHVTGDAARQTGLLQGTPVMTGLVDLSACALASGVIEPGEISMIAGTWSINQIVATPETATSRMPITALPHLDKSNRLISFNSARSAGNLSWVLSHMMTVPRQAGQPGDHPAFDRLADPALLDMDSPSFFPFLLGGVETGRGAFLGLGIEHTLPEVVTAMYEGVAFAHTQDSAPIWPLAREHEAIRLAGGAATSHTWAQLFADCFGRQVETLDCSELGAKGCAITAAVSLGAYRNTKIAARTMARVAARFSANADRHRLLKRRFDRWTRDAEWIASRS